MKLDIRPKRVGEWIKARAKRLKEIATRRIWLKVLSFVLAIMLWNYVVSGDTSLTRTKVLYNVKGSVIGRSVLSTYGLALLSDPEELLDNFTVQIDVAQSQYGYASTDNVRVTLDLSSVHAVGTQDVPLTAVSAYGKVMSITPETVSLTFEYQDSRNIPINVEFAEGVRDDYWYNVSRLNPATINVSGAASVVRSIVQARVYTNVENEETGFTRAEPYVLLDNEGNEINQEMLTRSSSSVTVVTEILPTKEIPISTAISDVVTGHAGKGYEVVEVSVQPETVTVAADSDLLDSISQLKIEPVSVEGATQSFTARAKISLLSDFKNVSAEEVYVNVVLADKSKGSWVTVAGLELIGLPEDYSAEYDLNGQRAWIEGDSSVIEEYLKSGIILRADVTGLGEGTFACALSADKDRYPDVKVQPENNQISVTLTKNEDGAN